MVSLFSLLQEHHVIPKGRELGFGFSILLGLSLAIFFSYFVYPFSLSRGINFSSFWEVKIQRKLTFLHGSFTWES